MIKLCEKWSWALCLAILMHIGIFYIFYLNFNKDASTQPTNSNELIVRASANKWLNHDQSTLNDTTYVPTLDATKISNNINSNVKETKPTTHEKTMTPLNTPKQSAHSHAKEKNSPKPSKAPVTPPEKTIQKNNLLKYQESQTNVYPPANNVESVESMKNRAGLLDIDTPKKEPSISTDKEYLSIKSEAEEINRQLSAAIKEVKTRNEQKIDEIEHLKNNFDKTYHQDITSVAEQGLGND